MKLLTILLRFFFHLLYHSFAWSYDLVAWLVSFGWWNNWVKSVLPFIRGTRVLELGHGPGHLQYTLLEQGFSLVGLDESGQMGRIALANLRRNGYTQNILARGMGQRLPFSSQCFDTVVATFPAEYIFDARTLHEVRRTLKTGGIFIVLPVVWIAGKSVFERLLAWLFKVTGQAPSEPLPLVAQKLAQPFEKAGFRVEIRQVEIKSSLLLLVLAENT